VEVIKEKLALYREYLRGMIIFILTISSALVVGFYQILIGKSPFFSIWFLSFGFIVLILFLFGLKFLNNVIIDLIKELENGKNNSR